MSGEEPWLARKLGRSGLLVAEIGSAIHLTVATTALRAFEHLYPAVWWPGFGLIAYGFVSLSSKRLAEFDRLAKLKAEEERRGAEEEKAAAMERVRTVEIDSLRLYKSHTAGNLQRLLKTLIEQTNHTRVLQAAFLSHAVDVVKDYLGVPRKDECLAATWVVPVDNYEKWETVAYDRNQSDRLPGRKRAIRKGIPGAAEAFLTGNDVFIEDTLSEANAKYFDPKPMYRSIFSMPARVVNVSRSVNVEINGQPNAILGVLNIDCKTTGILRADIAGVIRDIAYLLGVLEHINQGLGGRPNG